MNEDELIKYIIDMTDTKYFQNVILLTGENEIYQNEEIIITENKEFLTDILYGSEYLCFVKDIFLQEYESYEDAYRVARDMREVNPKCYN